MRTRAIVVLFLCVLAPGLAIFAQQSPAQDSPASPEATRVRVEVPYLLAGGYGTSTYGRDQLVRAINLFKSPDQKIVIEAIPLEVAGAGAFQSGQQMNCDFVVLITEDSQAGMTQPRATDISQRPDSYLRYSIYRPGEKKAISEGSKNIGNRGTSDLAQPLNLIASAVVHDIVKFYAKKK